MLDLVDEHTEPGPPPRPALRALVPQKMLSRVGGARRDRDTTGESSTRRSAGWRWSASARAGAPSVVPDAVARALLRADRVDGLELLAQLEGSLRARVGLLHVEAGGKRLDMQLRARLDSRRVPLRYVRDGDRILLALPDELASVLPDARLDTTKPLASSKLDVLLRSAEHGEFLVRAKSKLALPGPDGEAATDGEVEPVLDAHALVDSSTAAAGRALDAGDWELLARVTVGGFAAEERIRDPTTRFPLVMRVSPEGGARLVRSRSRG